MDEKDTVLCARAKSDAFVIDPQDDDYDSDIDVEESMSLHFFQDEMGRMHTLRSEELDKLKELIGMSAYNAQAYTIKTTSLNGANHALGIGAGIMAGLLIGQNLLYHQFDLIDFSIGMATIGVFATNLLRTRRYRNITDTLVEQNEILNDTYVKKAEEIYKQQQDSSNEIMFR